MEKSFHQKWKWYSTNLKSLQDIDKIATDNYYKKLLEDWCLEVQDSETNSFQMNVEKRGQEVVSGSIIYQQTLKDEKDYNIFHFFITRDFVITIDLDFSNLESSNQNRMVAQMENSENAIEGFLVILGEVMNSHLKKIDQFEIRLNELLWRVKEKNSTKILDQIAKSRHELLVWKNLMIPLNEVKVGMREAFGESLEELPEYKRTCLRIDRGTMLVKEYQDEIDTLIHLEELVSTHRGNEIMKTLTVLTTLFAPVSAWGALWGMNFKYMPELKWQYGYAISLLIIVVSTSAVYYLLRKNGWMGDILKNKEKNSFFK